MASSEAPYTASESTLVTRPKVREEVQEELREELRLVDMNRIPPEEKLRIERDAVTLAAGDVEMFEKSWRKTQPETISEIERRVDAMGTEAPAFPKAPPARAALPPRPGPPVEVPSLPPGARRARAGSGRLTPAEQRALAKHLGGTVQRASVLFATGRGRVVEVEYKAGSELRHTMVLLEEGGKLSTVDEIGKRLDAMPARGGAPSPAEAERATEALTGAGPSTRGQVVERIEGIGEAYGQKLRAEGVDTVEDLLARDAGHLAHATGISAELVRKWQAMGHVQAVRGIGPQHSEFLVRSGITSLEELARQTPEGLAKRLLDYQARLKVRVQGTPISPAVVAPWIEQARELTGTPAPAPALDLGTVAPPAPARAPAKAEEPAERKKLGLQLGRKPEPAPAGSEAPAAAKPKFALKLGRKPDEPSHPEAPAGEAPAEPGKKKFGLKLGRK